MLSWWLRQHSAYRCWITSRGDGWLAIDWGYTYAHETVTPIQAASTIPGSILSLSEQFIASFYWLSFGHPGVIAKLNAS